MTTRPNPELRRHMPNGYQPRSSWKMNSTRGGSRDKVLSNRGSPQKVEILSSTRSASGPTSELACLLRTQGNNGLGKPHRTHIQEIGSL